MKLLYTKREEEAILHMPPGDSRRTGTYIPKRSYLRPTTYSGIQSSRHPATNDAAASVVRGQIETILQKTNAVINPQQTPAPTENEQTIEERAQSFVDTSHSSPDSPYDRTHEADRTTLEEDRWKQYHSAWQDYYQQYYERYYLGEIYRMRQTLDEHTKAGGSAAQHGAVPEESAKQDEAYHELRDDLLKNVRGSAVKVRRSRHFMPFIAAGLTMALFLFLQYNRVLFSNVEAYVSPGNINPANIIVDPSISVPVSQDPRLIIPKINVDVPVNYDAKPDQTSQLQAMEGGVAWFGIPGADSHPGQIGNTVLSGHSSNDLFDPGNYKFIFARLEQLQQNDTFYINYLGTRYTYTITKKEVVKPTDVQKLIYPTTKPIVTLITCVPLGTAQNRLLVTAEQVSPNPADAKEAPSTPDSTGGTAMPGNSPTLLNRLFGN